MPLRSPAHKAETLVALETLPANSIYAVVYWEQMHGIPEPEPVTPEWDAVEQARHLASTPYRHALYALLLVDADPDEACAVLSLQRSVWDAFAELFFDRTVFPHIFAIHEWVEEQSTGNPVLRELYADALQQGPDPIYDRYRIGNRKTLVPMAVPTMLLADMVRRAKEHRGRSITSNITKEALKWNKAAIQAALQQAGLERQDGASSARDALVIRLRQVEATVCGADSEDEALRPTNLVSG